MRLGCARIVVWVLALVGSLPAFAHKTSDSYLRVRVKEAAIRGEWFLALHDLEFALGLDVNEDGAITWGELKSRRDAVLDYAASRLDLVADGRAAEVGFERELQVDQLANGGYAVVRFGTTLGERPRAIEIEYRAFFDNDPLHRGLLLLEQGEQAQQAVFSPVASRLRFEFASPRPWREFGQFVIEGVWHIWIGYDHVLFLLVLLLPSVLRRASGAWVPVDDVRGAAWAVVKVVTAFTVAHSVTLSLAAMGAVRLPSRLVESVIAASIVVAALNNLWPVVTAKTWGLAFGFGLIHGFGFATVLGELGARRGSMVRALVGFNLGVELGQLAVVGAFLPVAYALHRRRMYRTWLLRVGSVVVASLATWWMVERLRGGG